MFSCFSTSWQKDIFIENKEQGPTTSSKRVTMVDKIPCDTCVIAWIICVLKRSLKEHSYPFKIRFCPPPPNPQTSHTCWNSGEMSNIVGGVGVGPSKCSWIHAWLFVWRVWNRHKSKFVPKLLSRILGIWPMGQRYSSKCYWFNLYSVRQPATHLTTQFSKACLFKSIPQVICLCISISIFVQVILKDVLRKANKCINSMTQ